MGKFRRGGAQEKTRREGQEPRPVELDKVVVTVEELRALRPHKEVSLYTRIMGVVLRHLRIQAGLSQGELSRQSHVTRQEIGQLEHADHGIKVETLRLLCAVLRVPAGRVLELAERLEAGCAQF